MAVSNSPVYEGDVIFLYCPEVHGHIYSDPPGSKLSRVTVFTPDFFMPPIYPAFPNVQFAAFKILPSYAKPIPDTMAMFKVQDGYSRNLVYGRKIKLLHLASKKLLSFGSLKGKKPIHSNMAYLADWKDEQEDECLLRVLPTQTGNRKQMGEDVLLGDAIRLECGTNSGLFLLCIKNVKPSRFEVKKAVTGSVFTMSMHIRGHEKIDHGTIRGGAVVLISSLNDKVYLSSEESIVTEVLGQKQEKIYEEISMSYGEESVVEVARATDPFATEDLQQQINPVLSDLQVIGLCSSTSKEIFARKPRNFHGSQRITLCGDVFWQLEDYVNPSSGGMVQLGRKVRIKHVPSQRYLAVVYKNGKPEYLKLRKQCSTLVLPQEFAFSLVETDKKEGRLTKTSYVEIRHVYEEHVRSLIINPHDCQSFLRKGSIFEFSDGIPVNFKAEQDDQLCGLSLIDPRYQLDKRPLLFKIEEAQSNFVQDFYHALGVTRVLVDFAQKVVDVIMVLIRYLEIQPKRHRKFLGCICMVLKCFVNEGNKRCCSYLLKKEYIDLLLHKVGQGIKVEEVLLALARDEIKVSEMIVEHLIDNKVLEGLQEKGVPTLNLLSSLCYFQGRPVRNVQEMILDMVIKEKATLFSTKVDQDAQVVVISNPEYLAGIRLHDLKTEFEQAHSTIAAKSFVTARNEIAAQIRLFSQVCKGVNEDFVRIIVEEEKLVTLEEAFLCIQDEDLDPFLRSAYLDFIISALVDEAVGVAGTSVDKMWHTFDWENLRFNPNDAVADPYDGIKNEKARKMVKKLQAIIENFPKKCTEVSGTNKMKIEKLNAMAPLVAYGFYWNANDMKRIIDILLGLICGSHSEETIDEEKQFYELKTKALDILHMFFLRVSFIALQKLVYDYGFQQDKTNGGGSYVQPESIFKDLSSLESSASPVYVQKLMKIVRARLRYYHKEAGFELFEILQYTSNQLIKSLIDLIQFPDDGLRVSSCRLLFAIFHAEKTLFSEAEYSYIYTKDLYTNHDKMVNLAVFNDVEEGVDGTTEKLIWQMLHGYAESGLLKKRAIAMLEDLAELLIINRKEILPNPVNQNLAYSTGLVNRLLEYVHYYCKERKGDHTDLVTMTCLVLQRSVRRNKKVQEKIFEGYTDLLGAHVAPVAVAELLTEIFTDNAELCRKVSESELSLMFYIASTGDNQEELFTTLQAITKTCKSGPVLIPRFQDVLARLFLESVHSTFNFLLAMTDQSRHTYFDILENPNSDDSKLVKILNVCDLLCICAEGAKKFPEDVCQAIFSLEDLIEILEDNEIPLERKKPFAHLLTDVYLIPDRESLKAVSQLEESGTFWDHTKFAAQLMTIISDTKEHTIQRCFNTERSKFKVLLYYLANHHLSLRKWRKLSNGLSAPVTCSGHEEEPLLSSVLLYLMEGFLPMITAFCNQLSDKCKNDISSKLTKTMCKRKSELKEVGDGIMKVLQNQTLRNILLSSKYHVQLMSRCLESLMFFIPNSQWRSQNDALLSSLDGLVLSPSLYSALDDGFTPAVELNKSFIQFVKSYQHAYIGKAHKRSFGENLVPSDPSFKALISCFHHEGTTKRSCPHQKGTTDQTCSSEKCATNQRVNKLKPLLNFLHGLYHLLQQPLPYQERRNLDSIVFTILQLLSAITSSVSDCEKVVKPLNYEKVVKPLQEALVDIKPRGAHESVISHLDHPQNQVAVQAMAFLAALVYKGNEKTQRKIGQYLKHRDTELFMRMDAILELATVQIKASPLRTVGWRGEGSNVLSNGKLERKPEHAPLLSAKTDVVIEMTSLTCYQPIDDDDDYDQATDDQDRARLIPPDQTAARTKAKKKQTSVTEESEFHETHTAIHQEKIVEEAAQQVMVVLDLVAWMCHGQRTENQNLFREQENHFNSVNIVSQVALFLQVLVEPLRDGSIHIVLKATQALIELCTGNFANQQAVYKAQIVETISNVLVQQSTELREENKKKLLKLKSQVLELLNVLLQETSSDSFEMLQKISRDISTDIILETMLSLRNYQEENDEEENDQNEIDQMDPDARKGMFNAFHVLKRIGDNLNKPEKIYFDIEEKLWELRKQPNDSEKEDKAKKIEDISIWSRSVEVVYRSEDEEQEPVLIRVYFPFNPKEEDVVVSKREFISWKIDRDSPEKKLKDFTEWMKQIYFKIQHENNIQESELWRWKLWRWSYYESELRYYVLVLLTLLLNLLTIIFFKAPTNGGGGSGDNSTSFVTFIRSSDLHLPFGYFPVLYVLGSLHLILSMWMFIEYIVKNAKDFSFRVPFVHNLVIRFRNYIVRRFKNFIARRFKNSVVRRFKNFIARKFSKLQITIKKPEGLKYFEIYLIGFEPIYRFLFVCFSILSLVFSGYWYCGCLLYMFLELVVLEQVLTILRTVAIQLLLVFLLGLSIIFIYAVVSFAFFHAYFNASNDLYCETLAQCFATVTREGLLGSLTGAIQLPSSDQDPTFWWLYSWKVFFDLSFFVIITIIGFNVVVAIMVNSFSKLRDDRDAIAKDDGQTTCFICGVNNLQFEKKNTGFQNHVEKDHNMLNYIYFYLHLKSMKPFHRNAMEKDVFEQIENNCIKFFPLRRAKVLKKADQGQGKDRIKDGDTSNPGGGGNG